MTRLSGKIGDEPQNSQSFVRFFMQLRTTFLISVFLIQRMLTTFVSAEADEFLIRRTKYHKGNKFPKHTRQRKLRAATVVSMNQ